MAEASLHDVGADELSAFGRAGAKLVELTDVHAHPFCRGKGWSRLAVEAAMEYADKRDWDVYLRVCVYGTVGKRVPRLTTTQLAAFYTSLGFKPVGPSLELQMVRRQP